MANRKPESSRLNIFYIIQVLSEYSDQENPLSAQEIANKVNKEFSYLNESGEVISMDTVKRTLGELTDKIFASGMDYFGGMQRYGFWIHTMMRDKKGYVPYHSRENQQSPKKYYYLEHELQEAEITTLKDAVEAYCYFSEEDTAGIVGKLLRFAPQKMKCTRYLDRGSQERDEDSQLLMNIDDLARIIRERKGARITYCSYGIDKKLAPRPGYPKVVEPMGLMWSNGYYYLLAYSQKYKDEIMNLRIDRITEIEATELEDRHEREDFNPIQYRHEHPVMFTGPQGQAKLLCRNRPDNYMMNLLIDAFGKNARIHKAPTQLLEKYLPKEACRQENVTWLEVTVDSSLWGIELWAMQYCNDCRLISPKESEDRIKEELRKAKDLYDF